uniref:Solute carrier family 35 member C2 n=1 Tax=Bubo bubo TaxID=30461 RepID=A0A8C0E9X9_BUBBB
FFSLTVVSSHAFMLFQELSLVWNLVFMIQKENLGFSLGLLCSLHSCPSSRVLVFGFMLWNTVNFRIFFFDSLALSTSLDIGLSNWIQTPSSPGALWGGVCSDFVFALTQRVALLLVVLLIAGGLFMFTYKSTQFNAQGFVLVLCASFLGGIRWTLTQILMQKAELGLPLSVSEKLLHFHEAGMLLSLVGKLFLGGILAFGLGFSEFLLVSRTSSLTLSVAGIFKEICILFLATHLLGDRLSLLNWLGFAVCLSGISLHVILKAMNSKGEKALKLQKEASSDPDLELLLRHSEHGEEEEEDVETPQQH